MDFKTREIVDVFHRYAKCDDDEDRWCRKNVHGLNLAFLKQHGLDSSDELLEELKKWLDSKNILFIYANDPFKEKLLLQRMIYHIYLPPWVDRIDETYHKVANTYKKLHIPILNTTCNAEAHSSYNRHISKFTPSNIAKQEHGYHCSLADCHEMYLYYVMEYVRL